MTDKLKLESVSGGGTVECLGQTFPSDQARREHFLSLLAAKLKDPEFRKQEGFPKGTDEAILAMSDPPYYTACPNPWLTDFVTHYGRAYDPTEKYAREPMAIDVSEGKTDPIYKAHSYHTKVPHLAIVPSILHFTEPGDIVLDGFAGSGMTGVAAQWCGAAPSSYRHQVEIEWKKEGIPAPKWGARRSVLNDLSPAATFISSNYNLPFDVDAFAEAGKQLLADVESEIGWMYETFHKDGKTKGRIEYTVWSEVFNCFNCTGEIIFSKIEKKQIKGKSSRWFSCPHCGTVGTKEQMDIALETIIDPLTKKPRQRPLRIPVEISYELIGKIYKKVPDENDINVLKNIKEMKFPDIFPLAEFPNCKMSREGRMRTTHTTAIHHLFMERPAQVISCVWKNIELVSDKRIREAVRFFAEQSILGMSILNRHHFMGKANVNQWLNGVFYVPSLPEETSYLRILQGKLDRITKAFSSKYQRENHAIISTGTATQLQLKDNSIDYIFTDPPFGGNIYYADLNYPIENLYGVITHIESEAITDADREKDVLKYHSAMSACFSEYARVLKPGRWITVVFSNSQASIWNAIQVALQRSGFIVAEVATLDKKSGSFRQMTSSVAVKQDLVISAYKPDDGLETRLSERGAATESAWDFVETHLQKLPVSKGKNDFLEMVVERDPRRIYDRMVAWFVRHDFPVPLSTEEFLDGLRSRFPERDDMVFLPEQVAEYDRKRAQASQAPQMEMFVSDERSAIDWLADFLRKRPSTYQDIHPEFTVQMGAGWRKHEEKPELAALLEDNFLRFDDNGDVPNQIHSYLSTNFKDLRGLEKNDSRLKAKAKDRWYVPDPSKAKDLEQKRERSLLKEFDAYKSAPGHRIREFRLEVLRTGFKTAWAARDYKTIIGIAQKIPEEALQEDEKLLLWYDQALTRMEADA